MMVSDMEVNSAALSMSTTLVAFTSMSFWVTGQLKGLGLLVQLGVFASQEEEPIGYRPLRVRGRMGKASTGATRGYQ